MPQLCQHVKWDFAAAQEQFWPDDLPDAINYSHGCQHKLKPDLLGEVQCFSWWFLKVTEIYFSSAGFSSRWPRIAFRIMVFLPINTTTKYIRQTVTLTCHNCSVNFQNSMNFLQTINYLLSFGTVNTQCYAKHNMLHTAILHDLSCLHTTQCKNSQKRQDYTFLTKYYPPSV